MKKLLAFFACMAIFFSATAQEVTNDSLLNSLNAMKSYVCGLEKTVKKLSVGQSSLTRRQTELEKNQTSLINELNEFKEQTDDYLIVNEKAIEDLKIDVSNTKKIVTDVNAWINGIDTVAAKLDKPNTNFGQSYGSFIKKRYISSKIFWPTVILIGIISLFALIIGVMAMLKKRHGETIGSHPKTFSQDENAPLL